MNNMLETRWERSKGRWGGTYRYFNLCGLHTVLSRVEREGDGWRWTVYMTARQAAKGEKPLIDPPTGTARTLAEAKQMISTTYRVLTWELATRK